MINRYGMGVPPSPATPAPADERRMTMSKQPRKTFWQKIKHFFMKFNMCRCTEPKYEVLNGLLCCGVCRKPTEWANQPK